MAAPVHAPVNLGAAETIRLGRRAQQLAGAWADPPAGLVIAAVAVKDGREAWRGEGCCGPTASGPANQ